jgi:hypothetical protein
MVQAPGTRPDTRPSGLIRLMHRDERGQMAIAMLLSFLIVFLIFALALDAGLWYFDHRTAQNQVDAAALAGAQELPTSTTNAKDRALDWLQHNGATRQSICNSTNSPGWDMFDQGVAFDDRQANPSGYDAIRVCVRRDSAVVFSSMGGVTNAKVSAAGAAGIIQIQQAEPFAIYANCAVTTVEYCLEFPGQFGTTVGRVHSNKKILINGSNLTFNGKVTCAVANGVLNSGQNNVFSQGQPVCPAPDMPVPMPLPSPATWDLVFPFDSKGVCNKPPYTGDKVLEGTIAPGVYCTTGKIEVKAGAVGNGVTLITSGELVVSGNDVDLSPAWKDIILFSNKQGDNAITVSGQHNDWRGIVYAPMGQVKFPGSGHAGNSRFELFSSIIADSVIMSGSNWILNGIASSSGNNNYESSLIE